MVTPFSPPEENTVPKKTVPLFLWLAMLCFQPREVCAQATPDTFLIPDDTEVVLRLSEPLSSKHSYSGDLVRFTLDEDLTVGGLLIARKGDRASGTVMEVNRSGFVGQGGTLSLRVDYFKIGDTKIPIRGWRFREGESKAGTAIGLAVISPLGLLKKGKDTQIPEGTQFRAFVHGNTRIPRAILPATTAKEESK